MAAMMRKPLFLFSLGSLLAGVLATAALGQRDEPGTAPANDRFAQAPAAERARSNPYAGRPSALLAGRKLFRRHCAECHGSEAQGTDRAPRLTSPAVQNAAPGELAWFLKNGNLRRGMPSWSGLPEARRWQLVGYLHSLR
jgi:mono/diheme cytochrome c family protein